MAVPPGALTSTRAGVRLCMVYLETCDRGTSRCTPAKGALEPASELGKFCCPEPHVRSHHQGGTCVSPLSNPPSLQIRLFCLGHLQLSHCGSRARGCLLVPAVLAISSTLTIRVNPATHPPLPYRSRSTRLKDALEMGCHSLLGDWSKAPWVVGVWCLNPK